MQGQCVRRGDESLASEAACISTVSKDALQPATKYEYIVLTYASFIFLEEEIYLHFKSAADCFLNWRFKPKYLWLWNTVKL